MANAILLKVNQIGSVTETLETIELARSNGYKLFVEYNGRGMHPYNFKI